MPPTRARYTRLAMTLIIKPRSAAVLKEKIQGWKSFKNCWAKSLWNISMIGLWPMVWFHRSKSKRFKQNWHKKTKGIWGHAKNRQFGEILDPKYGNGGNLVVKCQSLLKQGVSDVEIGLFLKTIREQRIYQFGSNRFVILDILLAKHTINKRKNNGFPRIGWWNSRISKKYAHMNTWNIITRSATKRPSLRFWISSKSVKAICCFRAEIDRGFNIPCRSRYHGKRNTVCSFKDSNSRAFVKGWWGDNLAIYFPETRELALANFINEEKCRKRTLSIGSLITILAISLCSKVKPTKHLNRLWIKFEKISFFENKQAHGRLECKHCGRGNAKAKSKPFRTKNGLEYHMERSCKDAQRGVYRCILCNKAYAKEENRNACLDDCSINPPCEGRMSFDDFMAGFTNRDKLYDVEG